MPQLWYACRCAGLVVKLTGGCLDICPRPDAILEGILAMIDAAHNGRKALDGKRDQPAVSTLIVVN
jgi:hypothetical protein